MVIFFLIPRKIRRILVSLWGQLPFALIVAGLYHSPALYIKCCRVAANRLQPQQIVPSPSPLSFSFVLKITCSILTHHGYTSGGWNIFIIYIYEAFFTSKQNRNKSLIIHPADRANDYGVWSAGEVADEVHFVFGCVQQPFCK